MKPKRFGFALHPLEYRDLQKLKVVRELERTIPTAAIEWLAAHLVPNFGYGQVSGIRTPEGLEAVGQFYAIPKTTQMMKQAWEQDVYLRLGAIAHHAAATGCKILGLGAFTSIVGDGGITVSKFSPIPVTTGNGVTVVATVETVRKACARAGVELSNARVLVVGATGSIGEPVARMLAGEVGQLVLKTSPKSYPKLVELARELKAEAATELDYELRSANVIVSSTSSSEKIIDLGLLQPGAIVCDVARPFDTFGDERPNVLNIASAELILPGDVAITHNIGLPKTGGRVWACLAETAAIALSDRYDLATVGKKVCLDKVQGLDQLIGALGFQLAPLEGPNGLITDEQYERVAEAVGRRLVPA